MTLSIDKVLETCLYVDDLLLAEKFYQSVLGLELFSRQDGRHVFFRCGDQMLLLFNPQASADPSSSLPPHGAHGAGHVAFAIPEDQIADWNEKLVHRGITIERIVSWPSGGTSLYFRDPAGNSVELASPKIWGIA